MSGLPVDVVTCSKCRATNFADEIVCRKCDSPLRIVASTIQMPREESSPWLAGVVLIGAGLFVVLVGISLATKSNADNTTNASTTITTPEPVNEQVAETGSRANVNYINNKGGCDLDGKVYMGCIPPTQPYRSRSLRQLKMDSNFRQCAVLAQFCTAFAWRKWESDFITEEQTYAAQYGGVVSMSKIYSHQIAIREIDKWLNDSLGLQRQRSNPRMKFCDDPYVDLISQCTSMWLPFADGSTRDFRRRPIPYECHRPEFADFQQLIQ